MVASSLLKSKKNDALGAGGAANSAETADAAMSTFISAFEGVLVNAPAPIDFEGSVTRPIMQQFWNWMVRDIAPDLPQILLDAEANSQNTDAVLDIQLPQIITKIRAAHTVAQGQIDGTRRFMSQMGGEEVYQRFECILSILRCRPLLAKAAAFGRSSNAITDDATLGAALQSLPLKNTAAASVLFHALVNQSASPSCLVTAILTITGSASDAAVERSGFAPLVEALLAHAQNQISLIGQQEGVFADVDLICSHISRFHKLIRAVNSYLELEQGGRWSNIARELTKNMGLQVEPRLREVSADVSQSMRKPREGADTLDAARLLAALNGIYLLAAVRNARESMALNALFEKIWTETGQNLETLVNRNLDLFKSDPSDKIAAERLDMGIKMAGIRFNEEYADILRRARDSAGRRVERPS